MLTHAYALCWAKPRCNTHNYLKRSARNCMAYHACCWREAGAVTMQHFCRAHEPHCASQHRQLSSVHQHSKTLHSESLTIPTSVIRQSLMKGQVIAAQISERVHLNKVVNAAILSVEWTDYPREGPCLPTCRFLIQWAIAKPVTEPLLRQNSPTTLSAPHTKSCYVLPHCHCALTGVHIHTA